VKLLLLRAALK